MKLNSLFIYVLSPPEDIFFIAFRERRREREISMQKRSIDWWPPVHTQTMARTHNLGRCSDPEMNPQPFSYQPTEPHWPGLKLNNLQINNSIKNCADINRHFTKEDTQMANKHMKIYSTSYMQINIMEVQIKTTMTYHYTPLRMAET